MNRIDKIIEEAKQVQRNLSNEIERQRRKTKQAFFPRVKKKPSKTVEVASPKIETKDDLLQDRPATFIDLEHGTKPCVYFFYKHKLLLYIGASSRGLRRVFEFARSDSPYAGEGSKQVNILAESSHVEMVWCQTTEEAFNLERRCIQSLNPVYNRKHKI